MSKVNKSNSYIKQFEIETHMLSKNDLEVLNVLLDVVTLTAKLYEVQVDDKGYPLFYPANVSKAEIEKAALKDDQILSPYTVVERDEKGKLVATPYHIKYKAYLLPIAEKLREAARLTTDKEFSDALRVQADALLGGEYSKAQISWMKIKPKMLDIVIGPIERLEDRYFFTKRSYQAWVGIMHKSLTEKAIEFKNAVFAARRRLISPEEKVEFMDKAQIRADLTVVFAGMMAKYHFTAATLPNDIDILEKYGSEATIFIPSIREVFKKRHLPIFNTIFAPHFKQSFAEEELSRGYLYTVMMHEIVRVFIRYRYATVRLKELYPIFNEITVEVAAIKACGSLLLKDMISQKEMESVLVMFLTRIFDFYFETKDNPAMENYVLGNAILLNSLVKSEALQITKSGISWPNFTKMFIAVSDLAEELEKVLAEGSYNDAQHYLKLHSSLGVFKQFHLPKTLYIKGKKE